MNPGAKLAAFGLALAAALGAGAALGSAVGPIDSGGGDHGRPAGEEPAPHETPTTHAGDDGGH